MYYINYLQNNSRQARVTLAKHHSFGTAFTFYNSSLMTIIEALYYIQVSRNYDKVDRKLRGRRRPSSIMCMCTNCTYTYTLFTAPRGWHIIIYVNCIINDFYQNGQRRCDQGFCVRPVISYYQDNLQVGCAYLESNNTMELWRRWSIS